MGDGHPGLDGGNLAFQVIGEADPRGQAGHLGQWDGDLGLDQGVQVILLRVVFDGLHHVLVAQGGEQAGGLRPHGLHREALFGLDLGHLRAFHQKGQPQGLQGEADRIGVLDRHVEQEGHLPQADPLDFEAGHLGGRLRHLAEGERGKQKGQTGNSQRAHGIPLTRGWRATAPGPPRTARRSP